MSKSQSKMDNLSGLEPRGRAVLIKHHQVETLNSSVIHIPDAVSRNMQMLEQYATVVAVGESAWHDEPAPRAAVGDQVIVTKFAGFLALGPADGKMYRLVNDRDIFCAVTYIEEAQAVSNG